MFHASKKSNDLKFNVIIDGFNIALNLNYKSINQIKTDSGLRDHLHFSLDFHKPFLRMTKPTRSYINEIWWVWDLANYVPKSRVIQRKTYQFLSIYRVYRLFRIDIFYKKRKYQKMEWRMSYTKNVCWFSNTALKKQLSLSVFNKSTSWQTQQNFILI